MDLRTKLARLPVPPGSRAAPTPAEPLADPPADPRITRLRALIGDVVARDRARPPRTRATPPVPPIGEEHATPHGPLHVITCLLEPDHAHGRISVSGALAVQREVIALLALDSALGAVDPARMLILDTETTGLSGGTGTVAFLVGLAWFEDGCLRIEQLFLRDLGQEAPLLHRIAERVAAASLLVTYNGKSFDWPLLRTRFILNRIAAPALPPHLDLLHCARRLLAERLEGVRLGAVERGLLGHYREGDVDGSEIPGIYLSYLRGGDSHALETVLAHNVDDLIALPAILAALGARLACVRAEDDPCDQLANARLALRAGDADRALAFAHAVVAGGGTAELSSAAHALVGAVEQRRGRGSEAAVAWHDVLAATSNPEQAAAAHLALAKLYEHALADLDRAHAHARRTELAEGPHAHGRRLGRLRRRLERRLDARRT